MNLATAKKYADAIVAWLTPHCHRIEIAGSVRRGLDNCNDVDVVAIPKVDQERDMLGNVIREDNLLWQFLNRHVASGKATFQTGGNQPGKFCILQLAKCQLDVYFATPETFGMRLLCRTGSKEHNIWLCERAIAAGLKWNPSEGLEVAGQVMPLKTEGEIYEALNLKFIEPQNREIDWIRKNAS
jgi:DNA polymerase/3'-5' exonuclease PolX